jgi:dienelactone hydrolase
LPTRVADIEIPSGDDSIRAWFFPPENAKGPAPCLVLGHGFGLTRRCGLRPFAEAYASTGRAVLVFDYRGFGDSGGTPRQVVSFRMQLEDWRSAIAFARTRSEVDPDRIVTWGFSLGAGHALTIASRDRRVAAAVAVAPMFDGVSSTLAAMRRWSPWTFLRIVGRGIRDLLAAALGRAPVMVPIAAPPGELGLLTTEDAYPGYRAMAPDDFDFHTAARIGLLFWSYRPGVRLRRFDRPILVLPSSRDEINPPGPTMRRTRRCPTAVMVELTCAHMEITAAPHRERIIQSTLEFLRERVPSGEIE